MGPQYHILELPGENVLWICRIIIDRLDCQHIASGGTENRHRLLGLCRNVTSGVADHHLLSRQENNRIA